MKQTIKAVIDRVLWTAGATAFNRSLLADAMYEAIAREEAMPKSFAKLYSDNAAGIEAERLAMIEEAQTAEPVGKCLTEEEFQKTTLKTPFIWWCPVPWGSFLFTHPAPITKLNGEREALIAMCRKMAIGAIAEGHYSGNTLNAAADMLAADAQWEGRYLQATAQTCRAEDEAERLNGLLEKSAQQVAASQEPISVYRLMRKVDGVWVSASEFTTGYPDASWEEAVNKNPVEWRIQRHVTGKQIADGFAKALKAAPQPPQADAPPQRQPMTTERLKFLSGEYADLPRCGCLALHLSRS